MEFFDFTIRFDDNLHTLTVKNGLPIDQVADLLTSLSKALNPTHDEKIVLSEIRGNCYALNISTNSITKHETLKVIHRKISENDYSALNNDQRKYASKLKHIMADLYTVQAYDESKTFKVTVSEVNLPKAKEFFYEISSLYGVLTSIGGKALDGKANVHISGFNFDIEVTPEQELDLIQHYKKERLRLVVHKKVGVDSHDIKSAVLQSFEVIKDHNFHTAIQEFRSKYSELDISDFIQDSQ